MKSVWKHIGDNNGIIVYGCQWNEIPLVSMYIIVILFVHTKWKRLCLGYGTVSAIQFSADCKGLQSVSWAPLMKERFSIVLSEHSIATAVSQANSHNLEGDITWTGIKTKK